MEINYSLSFRKIFYSATVLIAMLFSSASYAHDQGPISVHSVTDKIYYGYGPAWNTDGRAWRQALNAAYNACVAAGEVDCILSVAAWDHCTFWGEGEFTHTGAPRYICISHPRVMVNPQVECEVTLGGVVNENGNCVVTTTEVMPYAEVMLAAGKSGRGWTEMGEDTTTTVKMYDWSGASWGEPFFDESETVREVQACYNPGGKSMGTQGQCGK